MARYTDSVCKLCRREATKLFLKGAKCMSDKCAVEKRPYPPGEHGRRRMKPSEYSLQLREKQKAKRVYGVLERQFRNYYDLAVRQKGITGENLLRLLETRLDNIVYRMGLASSRAEGRQFVLHGNFTVNDRRVTIPSYRVRPGDMVSVTPKGKEAVKIKFNVESTAKAEIPGWLDVDLGKFTGKVLDLPVREQIDAPVAEQLIVELYSK